MYFIVLYIQQVQAQELLKNEITQQKSTELALFAVISLQSIKKHIRKVIQICSYGRKERKCLLSTNFEFIEWMYCATGIFSSKHIGVDNK